MQLTQQVHTTSGQQEKAESHLLLDKGEEPNHCDGVFFMIYSFLGAWGGEGRGVNAMNGVGVKAGLLFLTSSFIIIFSPFFCLDMLEWRNSRITFEKTQYLAISVYFSYL